MWRPGDREGALDWLASLDTNQQRDLQRVMSAMGTARPMLDRMARARDFSERQYARAGVFTTEQLHRASEFTEQQLNRATEYGQQQWNRATDYGQQQWNRATEYGQQQLGRASEFGQQQWNRAGEGLTALRDKVKETKDRVVSNVSRWWDQRRGASTTRAAMVQAAFTASRQDPEVLRTIQQTGTTSKELKQLNELMSKAMYSPDAQTRREAFEQLSQTWEQLNGQAQPTQGQNAQGGGKHRAGSGNEVTAAWVNAGQPSASQAVIAQKQSNQGEAAGKTTAQTQTRKGPEQGK